MKDISKRLRFTILRRDKNRCQYCGRYAPEVKLHLDHIIPVSKGGLSERSNLITACSDCNLGKYNTLLTDTCYNSDVSLTDEEQKRLSYIRELLVLYHSKEMIDIVQEGFDAMIIFIGGKEYLNMLNNKYINTKYNCLYNFVKSHPDVKYFKYMKTLKEKVKQEIYLYDFKKTLILILNQQKKRRK